MQTDIPLIEKIFHLDFSYFTKELIETYYFEDKIQFEVSKFNKIKDKRKFVESTYEMIFKAPYLDLFSKCLVEFHQDLDGCNKSTSVQFVTKELSTKKSTIIFEAFIQSIYDDFGTPLNIVNEPIQYDEIFKYISCFYLVLFLWKGTTHEIVIGKREGRSFAVGFHLIH